MASGGANPCSLIQVFLPSLSVDIRELHGPAFAADEENYVIREEIASPKFVELFHSSHHDSFKRRVVQKNVNRIGKNKNRSHRLQNKVLKN